MSSLCLHSLVIIYWFYMISLSSSTETMKNSTTTTNQTSSNNNGNINMYSIYKNRIIGSQINATKPAQKLANLQQASSKQNGTVASVKSLADYSIIEVNGTQQVAEQMNASESKQSIVIANSSIVTTSERPDKKGLTRKDSLNVSKNLRMKKKIAQMLSRLDFEHSRNVSMNELKLTPKSRKYLTLIKSKRKLYFKLPMMEKKKDEEFASKSDASGARDKFGTSSNLTESASETEEKWVSFGDNNDENDQDYQAASTELDDESSDEQFNDEQFEPSKSRTRTVLANKAAASGGARLPLKLRQKIIERFLRSGGKPQNIAVSDSTITTTTQSNTKTVTTVYRIVPALEQISEEKTLVAERPGRAEDNDFSRAIKKRPFAKDVKQPVELPPLERLNKSKDGRKLKKILVTRVEIPQNGFLSINDVGKSQLGEQEEEEASDNLDDSKREELGEFYREPNTMIMGLQNDDDQHSISTPERPQQKKPPKMLRQQQRKRKKPGSLTKAKSVEQETLDEGSKLAEQFGGRQQAETSGKKAREETNKAAQIAAGEERAKRKESERDLSGGDKKSVINQASGSTKSKQEARTSRAKLVDRDNSQSKEDSLEQLKRSVLASSGLNSQNKTIGGSSKTSTPNKVQIQQVQQQQPSSADGELQKWTKRMVHSNGTQSGGEQRRRASTTRAPQTSSTTTTVGPTSPSVNATPPSTNGSTQAAQKAAPGANSLTSGAPKTHNIMMLIDFGPTTSGQQAEPEPRQLERQATGDKSQQQTQPLWSAPLVVPTQWRPLGEADAQPPTVNVQIFNQQPSAQGLSTASTANEFGEPPMGSQPFEQQIGPMQPQQQRRRRPNELELSFENGLESASNGAPPSTLSGWPVSNTNNKFSRALQRQQLTKNGSLATPATNFDVSEPHYSAPFMFVSGRALAGPQQKHHDANEQHQPLESSNLQSAILPGESAQTNRMIQRVIDEISSSATIVGGLAHTPLEELMADYAEANVTTSNQSEPPLIESEVPILATSLHELLAPQASGRPIADHFAANLFEGDNVDATTISPLRLYHHHHHQQQQQEMSGQLVA